MLAMVSVALFISEKRYMALRRSYYSICTYMLSIYIYYPGKPDVPDTIAHGESVPHVHDGYFSLRHQSARSRVRALSNASFTTHSSIRSPTTPGPMTSLPSSASSKASWSSILNASASGVRFLMSGQEGSSTPKAQSPTMERSKSFLMVSDIPTRTEGPGIASKIPENTDRKLSPPPSNSIHKHQGTLKSWSEPVAPSSHNLPRSAISFTSAGHQDPNEMVNMWYRPVRKHLLVNIKNTLSEEDNDNECVFRSFKHISADCNIVKGMKVILKQ